MDTADKTISTWTNKVSFWLTFSIPILLICFSVPLSSVSLNALKASILVIVSAIVLVFSLIEKINKKELDIKFSVGNVTAVLLCIIVLLSSIGSSTPALSFLGNGIEEPSGLTFISILVFSFLFAKYQKNNLKKFGIVFLIAYILSAIFSTVLFLFPSILNTTSGFNLFGSLNSFAIVSGVIPPLALLFFQNEDRKIIKIISVVGVIVSTIVLIFLNSKFAFIFSVLILGFSFFKNIIWNKDVKFPVFSFLLLTIFIFFIFGRPIVGDFFPNIINLKSSEISPNFNASTIVLNGQIKETPFLGIGPSKFLDSWMKYQPESVIESPFWNSGFHSGQNSLFYFGVTSGILGLVVLFWFIVYSIVLYFRKIKITDKIEINIEQTFVLSSFVSLFLFSLDISVLMFCFLGLVLIFSKYDKILNFQTNSNTKRRISLCILSFGLFLGISFLILGVFKFTGFILTEKSERIVVQMGDFQSAHLILQKAIKIFPNNVALENDLFLKKQIVVREINNSSSDLQLLLTDSITSARELINYNPDSYSAWSNVGAYFSELSRFSVANAQDEAQTAFNRAQLLSPKNPTPEFLIGRLYLIAGNIDQARIHLDKSLVMKKNYSDPYIYLGILEERNGNDSIAENNYQKAVEINFTERNFVNLGNFYLRKGDLENAKEAFVRAVALSSNINQNYLTLVMIYSSLGDNDSAVELLNSIIKKYPENEVLQNTLQKINRGESFNEFLIGKEVLIP